MIRIPYAEILVKIQEKTGMSIQEAELKVQQKLKELSGLVSKEGAANIVCSELGVKLMEASGKIKDIYPGMRAVDVVARVVEVYEARTFNRADGSASAVGSCVIGDETGVIRLVLWGGQAEQLKNLSLGVIIKLTNAYCRENNGRKEIHCGEQAKLSINPEGVSVGQVKPKEKAERKTLKALTEQDDNVEIMGTVVQVFDLKFFQVCPQCSKRVQENDGQFVCAQHANVVPEHATVFNMIIDDGTDTMRAVFFRNQTLKVINATEEKLQEYRLNPALFEDVKTALLGEQFKLIGRVKKNDFFQRLEFIVNFSQPADPKEELARLEKQNNNTTPTQPTEEVI